MEATTPANSPYNEPPLPKYTIDDAGMVTFEYDPEYVGKKYQVGMVMMALWRCGACWRCGRWLALAGAVAGGWRLLALWQVAGAAGAVAGGWRNVQLAGRGWG
jgi:hypothetical protein